VQVDPIKPTLKALGTKPLKLQYDELLSRFAFKFNLRRYTVVPVSLGPRMLLASHCIVLAHAGMDAAEDKLKHPRVIVEATSATAMSAEAAEGEEEEGDVVGQEEVCAAATRADSAHVASSTEAEGAGGLEEGGGCGGLELPAPGDGSAAQALTINGGNVTLDHLGPIVLNADGSLSRITNWDGMTGRGLHSCTFQLNLSRF